MDTNFAKSYPETVLCVIRGYDRYDNADDADDEISDLDNLPEELRGPQLKFIYI